MKPGIINTGKCGRRPPGRVFFSLLVCKEFSTLSDIDLRGSTKLDVALMAASTPSEMPESRSMVVC